MKIFNFLNNNKKEIEELKIINKNLEEKHNNLRKLVQEIHGNIWEKDNPPKYSYLQKVWVHRERDLEHFRWVNAMYRIKGFSTSITKPNRVKAVIAHSYINNDSLTYGNIKRYYGVLIEGEQNPVSVEEKHIHLTQKDKE